MKKPRKARQMEGAERMDIEKEQKAIERLRAFEPRDGSAYYLAYSGGKDSDAILILAELAAVEYEAVHNLTTADAPETVYYVRSKGNVTINKPKKSMWQLIPEKLIPPTRLARYCCSELKERGGAGRVVITGVRWAESRKRKESADVVRIIGGKKTVKKAEELGADYKETRQGGIILNNDNEETRKLVEHCHMQSKVMVNPIVDWTDDDVWEFLRHYGCKSNPLYECGFKRVGCIGCPMVQKKRYEEFALYPKYEASYKRAFAKMLEKRKEKNLPTQWETAEDVFRWWMEEDYTQLRFSDLGVMR